MKYICQICGYIYDEARENVPFRELPDTWKCPVCSAAKKDFKPEETKKLERKEGSAPAAHAEQPEDLKELNAGQFAALCSNLARACEKQYKPTESGLFKSLAEYFSAITPEVPDASVEQIAALLESDIGQFPIIRETADKNGDRGAARATVWGEKVTRMLSSLVGRYLEEGESMVKDTSVWICTSCGFVYIGDSAPELCPVCKVPSWKFEKIEGRA